jgi:hypothetical protein
MESLWPAVEERQCCSTILAKTGQTVKAASGADSNTHKDNKQSREHASQKSALFREEKLEKFSTIVFCLYLIIIV